MSSEGSRSDERVAVVTTSYPRDEEDPAGHFVRAEVRALERAGAEVQVFAPGGPAFGWPGAAARIRARWSRAAAVPAAVASWSLRYRRAAATRPFDRTVAHWVVPSAAPIALTLPRMRRGALELVSHGADVRLLLGLPRAARGALVASLARSADAWRFPSTSLLATLEEGLSPRASSMLTRLARIVPPALDLPSHGEAAARVRSTLANLNRDRAATTYVTVARLVPSKRVDRALAHAKHARARLVVVGDGPEREALAALARALDVDALFLGTLPRSETLAWIAEANALVHASMAEGLSCVVREAEALGTKVIHLR